jgi:hypothetical protein
VDEDVLAGRDRDTGADLALEGVQGHVEWDPFHDRRARDGDGVRPFFIAENAQLVFNSAIGARSSAARSG